MIAMRRVKERDAMHAGHIDTTLPSPSLQRTHLCISVGMKPLIRRELANISRNKWANNSDQKQAKPDTH
jgi:hypothetical protein